MNGAYKLRHLHLEGLTPYLRASAFQDRLVRVRLDHIARRRASPFPNPYLITFQTPPTYTCGRREINKLNVSQKDHLKAGGAAEFYEAKRGGQTTFHGPGQLTAFLILSLQAHGLNTRTYIKLLEGSTIDTCERYGLATRTSKNTGVWVGSEPDERKIASIGVHMRRNITNHGVGVNVDVDLSWFDRIVACGLVGKYATSISKELNRHESADSDARGNRDEGTALVGTTRQDGEARGAQVMDLRNIADTFAGKVAKRLRGVDLTVESVENFDYSADWINSSKGQE